MGMSARPKATASRSPKSPAAAAEMGRPRRKRLEKTSQVKVASGYQVQWHIWHSMGEKPSKERHQIFVAFSMSMYVTF